MLCTCLPATSLPTRLNQNCFKKTKKKGSYARKRRKESWDWGRRRRNWAHTKSANNKKKSYCCHQDQHNLTAISHRICKLWVSEKLEQIAKPWHNMKNKKKKTQLRTMGKPNLELFVQLLLLLQAEGGWGGGDGGRMDGRGTYMMSTTCLYVFLLTRTLDSTSLACSESVFSMELRDARKLGEL